MFGLFLIKDESHGTIVLKGSVRMSEKNEDLTPEIKEVKKEAEVFLNEMNDNIGQSIAGLATFIRKDNTSDTWFFAETEDELYLTGSLIIKQIADYLDENMFEVILHMQTKLSQVYTEDYKEYVEKIQEFGKQFE